MNTFSMPNIQSVVDHVRGLLPEGFVPQLALVTGSGLDGLAQELEQAVMIPYDTLPNWPGCSVKGHAGNLCLGWMRGMPVMVFQGRFHWYEGQWQESFLLPPLLIQALGCRKLLITNASGGIHPDYAVGDLVMITDHINFQGVNPLIGLMAERSTFVGMENAYDADWRVQLHEVAHAEGIELKEGVYLGVLGPHFETPAEIRAFARLGADLVGMSTVPDVIAARFCELQVAAIAVISNPAAGLTNVALSHEVTLAGVRQAGDRLQRLLMAWCAQSVSEES